MRIIFGALWASWVAFSWFYLSPDFDWELLCSRFVLDTSITIAFCTTWFWTFLAFPAYHVIPVIAFSTYWSVILFTGDTKRRILAWLAAVIMRGITFYTIGADCIITLKTKICWAYYLASSIFQSLVSWKAI